ncbi:WD40/YVTN/BNR-like repeat-containing protein [Sphingobacterium chungjuense]|uniref:WD40/YVTN/BNR-like repeat-containing protein n=1 Tax=Sphingobacterium chungjuense TaxID=2675553 RepID=UPI001F0E7D08|nr:YCF48-related protein [Sphingobacterium chungjuense]
MKLFSSMLTGLCCFAAFVSFGQSIEPLTQKANCGFRGLDTFGERVIWVSGTNGTVGKSLDKGKSWEWVGPKGYEETDFRDIAVFSNYEAVIVSAGAPAVILRTMDGGKSWTEVYHNDDPEIFLNGMDFYGDRGFAIGDPIDGFFQLLQTTDRGETWEDVSGSLLLFAEPGEVGFAASGTGLQVQGDNLWIGSGGSFAALYRRNEKKMLMHKMLTPIISGASSQGIFSLSFWNNKRGVVVGGDYLHDQCNEHNVYLTHDGGENWITPAKPVGGFRSAVLHVNKRKLVATGTSGTDISTDGGQHWNTISTDSYNVLGKSRTGKRVYLAGSNGQISVLQWK